MAKKCSMNTMPGREMVLAGVPVPFPMGFGQRGKVLSVFGAYWSRLDPREPDKADKYFQNRFRAKELSKCIYQINYFL